MGVDKVHDNFVMCPVRDLCAHLGITPGPVSLLRWGACQSGLSATLLQWEVVFPLLSVSHNSSLLNVIVDTVMYISSQLVLQFLSLHPSTRLMYNTVDHTHNCVIQVLIIQSPWQDWDTHNCVIKLQDESTFSYIIPMDVRIYTSVRCFCLCWYWILNSPAEHLLMVLSIFIADLCRCWLGHVKSGAISGLIWQHTDSLAAS
jgi:hypothetical protein